MKYLKRFNESYSGANDAGLVRVYGKDDLEECDSIMLEIENVLSLKHYNVQQFVFLIL